MQIKFLVPCTPVAQPRVKFANGHAYTPRTIGKDDNKRPHPVLAFKATLRMVALEAYSGPPLAGPLGVELTFVFPRQSSKIWKTKGMPRYRHVIKPDSDNCLKAFQDALSKQTWIDDTQICETVVHKWHASGDEQPHCLVVITKLED